MPLRKLDQPNRHKDPAAYTRWWRENRGEAGREQERAYHRAYHAKRKVEDPAYGQMKREAAVWTRRKCKYGISRNEYDRMHRVQEGKCAICRDLPDEHNLRVDHDHRSGRVRALLCNNCNAMLGHARDNIRLLEAGAGYLRQHGGIDFS